MKRLQKRELLFKVEDAIRASGFNVLYLSSEHPASYRIYDGSYSRAVKVYIWNISHGGKNRPDDEYRIQVTGVHKFEPSANACNIVLGWWDRIGVFGGWDIRQHAAPLGASPSLQISEGALRNALHFGFAPYVKENDETAIAFRPDFMGTYIRYLETLHDSGKVPAEAEILRKLSKNPKTINEKYIDKFVAEERKRALISTMRNLRALDFRERVLSAYGHRCAMCGVQLRLIEGAHILPVSDPKSTDQTANGVALCALHHRAYDNGFVTFDAAFSIHINEKSASLLKKSNYGFGLKEFRNALKPTIHVPAIKSDRPATKFVNSANALRGWSL